MKRFVFLSAIVLTFLSNKCEKSGNDPAPYASSCENPVVITTNDLTGLDGCTWVLTLEDGTRLEPINLKTYIPTPVEGEKVWVSLAPAKNMASICMVGPMVEITCLERQTNN